MRWGIIIAALALAGCYQSHGPAEAIDLGVPPASRAESALANQCRALWNAWLVQEQNRGCLVLRLGEWLSPGESVLNEDVGAVLYRFDRCPEPGDDLLAEARDSTPDVEGVVRYDDELVYEVEASALFSSAGGAPEVVEFVFGPVREEVCCSCW